MRTLIHMSDLHFGRVDQGLLAPLRAQVVAAAPDVVIVSGDLTQRARSAEFIAARAFLDTLPGPRIVVPGNHDIPLHNLLNRFARPLAKYTRFITDELEPYYSDDEIAVIGLNTARSLTIKDGRINHRQIAAIAARFETLPKSIVKVVVTHHPFDLPDRFARRDLVGRAPVALEAFAACGADLLLAGHLHVSHSGSTAAHYPIADYAALAVQAGTATSTRARGEENSFNVIRIDDNVIVIERFSWKIDRNDYVCMTIETFHRTGSRWLPAATSPEH